VDTVYRLDKGVFTGAEKGGASTKRLPRSRFPHNGARKYDEISDADFQNLLRSKRRNILTILSIAVSLFYLLGAGESANFCQPDAQRYNLIRSHHLPHEDGLAYPLPVAYRPKIAAIPHVVAVARS